jgi:GTP cyclohydrolase III
MTLYDELAVLTEGAAAAAHAGRIDHLSALQVRLGEIMAVLPLEAPTAAAPALRRAAAANAALDQVLETEMATARQRLGRLRDGRRATAGYMPASTRVRLDRQG